jgi:hypothetical protein
LGLLILGMTIAGRHCQFFGDVLSSSTHRQFLLRQFMGFSIPQRRQKAPFPVLQGQLDFLCYLYAAANAMHKMGEFETIDEAAEPFQRAVRYMQDQPDWDLAMSLTKGVDAEHIEELLCACCERDVHLLEASKGTGFTSDEVAGHLSAAAGAAAVVSLFGRTPDACHYIAASLQDDGRIELHDSEEPSKLTVSGEGLFYSGEAVKVKHIWIIPERQ